VSSYFVKVKIGCTETGGHRRRHRDRPNAPAHFQRHRPGRDLEFYKVSASTVSPPIQIMKPIKIRFGHCHQPLNERQWRYVLARAASLDGPSAEYTLATDARAAARSEQFRQAVLDAATSVELSLNCVLDGVLTEIPESIPGARRRKHRMLGQLVSVLSKANSLPTGINEEEVRTGVVDARNRAMHEARSPAAPKLTPRPSSQ
jgi:hypothetical protein